MSPLAAIAAWSVIAAAAAQQPTLTTAPRTLDGLLQNVERAIASNDAAASAASLNDLGAAYMDADEPLLGLAAFADAARLAPRDTALALVARVNVTRTLHEAGAAPDLVSRLAEHASDARTLAGEPAKTAVMLTLAELYLDSGASAAAQLGGPAHELVTAALALANEQGDAEALARAYGELGAFYAAAGSPADALAATRRAVLVAQPAGAPSLYRWEWQAARLLRARGNNDDALLSYGAAIRSMSSAESTAATSRRGFRRDVLPLYREYADLMLARARTLDSAAAAEVLGDVQRNVELLRIAEVRNYFESRCTIPETSLSATETTDALVIYPMLFDDRLELLVSTGRRLQQFTVDVSLAQLTSEARLLRETIETDASGDAFLAPAQQLYRWLVAPLEGLLTADVKTLVFVPDGALRTVPLAVLHDGGRFLVERYALASTPSLSLIGNEESQAVDRVLVNGIIEPLRGYAGLPFVADELESVQDAFPSRVYSDESFTTSTLAREIVEGDYTVVHLATHAQFESDYRRSFLLAYDDLITMDELEGMMGSRRFSDRPVDLLVLSACETAAGDDRAALGLAGVAVKAGARSALASLWFVNDQSTALLIGEFYRQLSTGRNKAEALRGAQLFAINDARYAHPAYWAPFLLIGEWQ